MYASGIPIGLLVDAKGPRPGVLLGCAMLGVGYFALYGGSSFSSFKEHETYYQQHTTMDRGLLECRGSAYPAF